MKCKCPHCRSINSGVTWDSATLRQQVDITKINDFSDNDVESIEMQIPGYTYICPACGAESIINDIPSVK